jgi:hypothetical protein
MKSMSLAPLGGYFPDFSDAEPSDAEPSDAEPSDAESCEADPSDAESCDVNCAIQADA